MVTLLNRALLSDKGACVRLPTSVFDSLKKMKLRTSVFIGTM